MVQYRQYGFTFFFDKKRNFEEENSIIFNNFRLYTSLIAVKHEIYKVKRKWNRKISKLYVFNNIILFYCIKLLKIDYIFYIF